MREMTAHRLALAAGLVAHKLLWEVMRTRTHISPAMPPTPVPIARRVLKVAKAFALLFLLFQTLVLDLMPISRRLPAVRVVGSVLYLAGLLIAVAGRLHLGDNWANLEDSEQAHPPSLVTGGIYRYIRHPIYVGDALLLVGLQLALNSRLVIFAPIPGLVAFRRAAVEEALLSQRFHGYEGYRRQTGRFFPRFRKRACPETTPVRGSAID